MIWTPGITEACKGQAGYLWPTKLELSSWDNGLSGPNYHRIHSPEIGSQLNVFSSGDGPYLCKSVRKSEEVFWVWDFIRIWNSASMTWKRIGLGLTKGEVHHKGEIFEKKYLEDPATWMNSNSNCWDRRQAQVILSPQYHEMNSKKWFWEGFDERRIGKE